VVWHRRLHPVDCPSVLSQSPHTSITQAAELGQRAGFGLDKIRAFSRHRSIVTLMTYVDEHDREQTQRSLSGRAERAPDVGRGAKVNLSIQRPIMPAGLSD
jgi:hypothetical protein